MLALDAEGEPRSPGVSQVAYGDDELFAAEDCIADFYEAKATFEVATLEIAGANRAVGKVHKLVLLSEGVAKDPMLARQRRRKFV